MNVTLVSHFRDATRYVDRYFRQVSALRQDLATRSHSLWLVLGEGDSSDDTRARLTERLAGADAPLCQPLGPLGGEVIDVAHGGPYYGSVVHPERFRQLAYVCNQLWMRLPDDADAVVFCESDLIWESATIVALIDRLAQVPVVAPMLMAGGGRFYDVWGFRKNGRSFAAYPPYFDGWPTTALTQIDSAGSCLAMRGEVARAVGFPPEDVLVGLCRLVYERGHSVWLEPQLEVMHP